MRRHVAVTALAHSLVRLVAHASIVPDFITDNILDVRVVCPPDSFLCPHGGRAFRDKRHDCAFTPCEFVTPGTPAPAATRTRDELRRASAAEWFRDEEFVVPRVRGRDLARGKQVAARVTASLRLKSQRALHWRASYTVATTVDVVVLAPPRPETNRTAAHSSILADALSSGTDAPLAPRDPLRLVAAQAPWSRYAFFGWLARQRSVASVRAMLDVVQHANSLEALVRSKPASWSLDEFFLRVKPQVIVAVPTLVVVASDESGPSRRGQRDGDHRGGSDSAPLAQNATGDWFASQSETLQRRVLAFLEHELWTLGLLELAPVTASSSVDSARGADSDLPPRQSDRLVVTASVRFAAQYGGSSASLAVFLTPLDALVGRDEDSHWSSSQTEETYAGDFGAATTPSNASLSTTSDAAAAAVWNFTLLTCSEHAKRLRELHSRIPLTVLRADHTTSRNDTSRSSSASAASGNGSDSSTASAVVSCWVYQPMEHARPVAAVQYVHHR